MKQIQLGIIGLGRLGFQHASTIANGIPDATLAAACSVVDAELDAARDAFHPAYLYRDYRELLLNKDLDGVIIATNSQFHCEMALAAMEAGVRHLYMEKPLGMSLAEIDSLRDAQMRTGIPLFQVGYNRRFDKSYLAMKKKLDEGYIGKPVLVRMTNRDPASMAEFIVKFSPTSGGLVFDMLTHDYDLLRWFLGCDAKSVYGLGGVYAYPGLAAVNDIDNCTILCRFENETMAFLETTRSCPYGYHVETEIFGTEGCLRMGVNPNNDRVLYMDKSGVTNTCTSWFYEHWEPTFAAEIRHFVDCIRTGSQPLVGLMDGYKAVEWAIAAGKAVATESIVHL